MATCCARSLRASPWFWQVVETFVVWANFRLVAVEVGAHDVEGGVVIHSGGADLGLAALWFFSKGAAGHRDKNSIYSLNLFSMAETIFLFVLWPSFQAAVAGKDEQRFMVVSNWARRLCPPPRCRSSSRASSALYTCKMVRWQEVWSWESAVA